MTELNPFIFNCPWLTPLVGYNLGMQFKLVQYKENMYASFWLMPLLMSLLTVALMFCLLYLDYRFSISIFDDSVKTFFTLENSKTVLSIIATSVITVASVTFSITVLVLSTVSNQLGPRLLPNFMRQKSTQLVMGFFIGTFIYALIVIQIISTFYSNNGMPYLTVFTGLLLGIISFFLLIYFIHFVCHAIQVDNVLDYLVEDLTHSINRQFKDLSDDATQQPIHPIINKNQQLNTKYLENKKKDMISSTKSGYIQTIDYQALLDIATEKQLLIHLLTEPGQFIFKDLPIMTIYSEQGISELTHEKCHTAIQAGLRRSTVQDVEFAFEELSEVAVRALSPGINIPYTAKHALDRMVQGFAMLANKQLNPNVLSDENDQPRLVRKAVGYSDILRTSLNRFRQQAKFDLSVSIHILNMFADLLMIEMPNDLRQCLVEHAKLVYQDATQKEMNTADQKDLTYFYQKVIDLS